MQNSYTVINASAGSGKTYQLVQRLLMICLRYPKGEATIRNILALTFTNKAANEMKERILSWLGKFAGENYEDCDELIKIQEAYKKEGLHITLKELHERSKKLLDYILHHYSTLNIGTIDKFNARLVRSFSYELGLAKNFNLEIQPEPFLLEAVDKMLDKIGENETISDAFMDFVTYNLDNNDRVNLNKTLYGAAKEFVKDIHYEHLKDNSDFDWEKYEETKNRLRTEIKNLAENSLETANTILDLLEEKNLSIDDFSGGSKNSIAKFFVEIKKFYQGEREDFPLPANETSAQDNFQKGASSKSKKRETEIFEILDFLIANRNLLIQNHILISKKERILSALLPLKVNKDIQDELLKIEEENDVVLLSKFNILINENLANEPSAFIYEKVGSQFHHYFFDEFQDTSQLQWKNFVPLRDHSVSTENTSFTLVGDPKQSIYRFRGGDSQLMLNIINKTEVSPKEAELVVLDKNWRSAKNIVQFNNELYQYLSDFVEDEHRDIFGKSAQQIAESDLEGRVKISLLENLNKEDFYRDSSEKMQKDIQECIDNGFRFADITVLCRGNKDIFNYSQKLGSLKVNYNGVETNIKTISESGLTLELSNTLNAVMQLMNWENNPKNMQYLTLMMYYLNELGRIKMNDFTGEMLEILKLANRDEIEHFIADKYCLKLRQTNYPRLNLYNFVEYYINEFSVPERETDFLLNFLEVLYGFTQNSGATVKDFIKFWDEEARKKTILASENIDAIQMMTIHKAKGLEFPVVFYPMLNENTDGKFSDWFNTEENEILKSVNLKSFDKILEVYDEKIEKFNNENSYKNLIDRFCIQYVATTRPVEQLFLYIQRPTLDSKTEEEKESKIEIYDFVQQKNLNNDDEFDYFGTPKPEDLKKNTKQKTLKYQTKSIGEFSRKHEKASSIKIATPSKSYQNRNEKVRTGIFVHDILSKINSEKDVDFVLENFVLDGTLTLEEKAEISTSLQKIISENAQYFGENLEIINEKDIMISENGVSIMYRPDRIIASKEGYIILDFKTGDAREKHQKQIEIYKNVLEKLGRKVLKTELIYV